MSVSTVVTNTDKIIEEAIAASGDDDGGSFNTTYKVEEEIHGDLLRKRCRKWPVAVGKSRYQAYSGKNRTQLVRLLISGKKSLAADRPGAVAWCA